MDAFCVIGGGAVGSVIAYHLYRGGAGEIHVYYGTRRSLAAVEENRGIIVEADGSAYLVPVKASTYPRVLGRCHYVFHATKAYSVPDTMPLLHAVTGPDTHIFSLQNGFGSCELLKQRFPGRAWCGVVYFGSTRISPSHVRLHGPGSLVIEAARPLTASMEVARILRRGGLDTRVAADIGLYRWLKLAVNAAINPVTALLEAPNGVLDTREGEEIARMVADEVACVARHEGYGLDPWRLARHIVGVARATRLNYSSMYQDVAAGRETEVDYINGYVARLSDEYGCGNANKTLWLLMRLKSMLNSGRVA